MSDYSDFDHFGLDPRLVEAVRAMGYTRPTPIQSKAIPIVLKGGDVMGAAQTGTGKTAGFALPILHRLLPRASASMSPARHPVRALILVPTRELADQVGDNVRQYAAKTPLRTAVVFGGMAAGEASKLPPRARCRLIRLASWKFVVWTISISVSIWAVCN